MSLKGDGFSHRVIQTNSAISCSLANSTVWWADFWPMASTEAEVRQVVPHSQSRVVRLEPSNFMMLISSMMLFTYWNDRGDVSSDISNQWKGGLCHCGLSYHKISSSFPSFFHFWECCLTCASISVLHQGHFRLLNDPALTMGEIVTFNNEFTHFFSAGVEWCCACTRAISKHSVGLVDLYEQLSWWRPQQQGAVVLGSRLSYIRGPCPERFSFILGPSPCPMHVRILTSRTSVLILRVSLCYAGSPKQDIDVMH